MRLATKPISSPGRTEKFPPPFMRFLRTNVGSRSRGRSRSSPMFVIRKKSTSTVIETQEPSSPKVTCMGQVRVRRSKLPGTKSTRPSRRTQTPGRRRCRWIRNSLSCYHFNKKFKKPKSLITVWRKCVLFFHVDFKGRKRRSKTRENSPKFESKLGNKSEDLEQGDEEEEEEDREANRVYASTSIFSPPKNALLLTRSRSAPYRSSSLASRFWGSPLASEEIEQQKEAEENREPDENREDENPASKTEPVSENSSPNSRTDPEMGPPKIVTFTDFEGSESESESVRERFSSDARIEKVKATEEEEEEEAETARPSILTRCKSEPARIAATVDPELSFWKKRRLGFT